jgi:hypothetical protein
MSKSIFELYYLHKIVLDMRNIMKNEEYIKDKIKSSSSLIEKCILIRNHIKPQSTFFENIIKNDLGIENPKNNVSGDGLQLLSNSYKSFIVS